MSYVTVLYPATSDSHFDFAYYLSKHMPMVGQHLGDNLVGAQVRKGLNGADGSLPSFACVSSIEVKSLEAFKATLAQHGAEILGDIPNFTNVEPVLQFDEVVS